MAKKKPRTPPPPRRVQAPQRRHDQHADDLGARHRTILYAIAGSGILALVIVVALVATSGGSSKPNDSRVAGLMAAAGCTFRSVKASVPGGQTHVASLTAKLPWNTSPPSNGQHYPEWAVWGFYTEAVNPRRVVHNEEHGGVVVWWGSKTPQSTVAKLKAFYDEQPTGSFGTPYANFGSKIAISAWTGNPATYQRNGDFGEGHIATCPSYTPATKKAFEAFRNTYRGHGPEGIPLSADQPGMGPPTS
ncbi:MAG: DUF3105 domain-containing protein [Gaiellaceae bacterium]